MRRFVHQPYLIALIVLTLTSVVSLLSGSWSAVGVGSLASALLLSVARHNTDRKEHQLLVWGQAYTEWRALRREKPSTTLTTQDLLNEAHDVFFATPEEMRARWWENDVGRYVHDARTWNAVLEWRERNRSLPRT